MKPLVNHPGMSLSDAAADSLARFERDHGVQPLTSAYRPVAEQQALIDQWDRGGPMNRPPYLYAPRRPASEGLHTKGVALDTEAPDVFHTYGVPYGWLFLYAYDTVHFEYVESWDTKPGQALTVTPAPPAAIPYQEENNVYSRIPVGNTLYLFNHVTGKKTPIPGRRGTVDYHQLIRRALGNDGTDAMNMAELDLVAGIMAKTF